VKRRARAALRAIGVALLALAVTRAADSPLPQRVLGRRDGESSTARRSHGRARDRCAGPPAPLPPVLTYELRAGAFPGSGHPDVAVHVPPDFDAMDAPGAILYFHGWNGCVGAALSGEDVVCSEGADPRPGSDLARQLDEAHVNALLVAVELRVDMSTGEAGALEASGGARELMRELLDEHLAEALGCRVAVEELDRIVVAAHSGGYQAAASTVLFGDLPQITEVDLLDAYYGADDVVRSWALDAVDRFDGSRRFVDLYTTGGGTGDRSRSLAALLGAEDGAATMLAFDDGDAEVDDDLLAHALVVKHVPREHMDVPRAYFRSIVENAGFVATHPAGGGVGGDLDATGSDPRAARP
jgi:hypothetical protein